MNFVTLARVIKTQGRHGEVAAEIHSDIPGRLHSGMKILALSEDGSRRELQIDDVWPHKNWLVLKFAGVDSISDAEVLIGRELQLPASERAKLEEGVFYVSDLVGCEVVERGTGQSLGVVTGWNDGGSSGLLEVGPDLLIPFVRSICVGIDIAARRIEVELPEGLKDVNRS